MASLNPYICFGGKTREAMTFYKNIFGGELELNEVGGSPMAEMWPSGDKTAIFHSSLHGNGVTIMGTDMTRGPVVVGNAISMAIGCKKSEIESLFNQLADGGKIDDPLKEQFWGAIFGAVTDKFGISWMLNGE